jgi:hypothetical protein
MASASRASQAQVGALNHFNVYTLASPLTINSGDFVVGFRANNPANIFPADRDTTPPSRMRSYSSSNGTDFEIIDTFGASLAGTFGIRALISNDNCPAITGLNPSSGTVGSTVTIPGQTSPGPRQSDSPTTSRRSSTSSAPTQITATVPERRDERPDHRQQDQLCRRANRGLQHHLAAHN